MFSAMRGPILRTILGLALGLAATHGFASDDSHRYVSCDNSGHNVMLSGGTPNVDFTAMVFDDSEKSIVRQLTRTFPEPQNIHAVGLQFPGSESCVLTDQSSQDGSVRVRCDIPAGTRLLDDNGGNVEVLRGTIIYSRRHIHVVYVQLDLNDRKISALTYYDPDQCTNNIPDMSP